MIYVLYTKWDCRVDKVSETDDLEVCKKWYKENQMNFYCNKEDFERTYG